MGGTNGRDARPLLWLVLALLPVAAPAQVTTGTLTGTLRDSSGAALPGATLEARHAETGLLRSTVTGARGVWVLAALPPGTWSVRASLPGFRPLLREGLALAVGDTAVVDGVLEPGGFEQEVTVVAEPPLVQTRSGELSHLVEGEQIESLPLNGRNYTDLALLQPGVQAFPYRDGGSVVAHGLGASVNGQDPRSNVYLLDGTLLNDFTNGPAGSAASTSLGLETVREFRIETNAYGAEFGRNAGGQIHVVTKSGGNRFSGSAFEYHRNDALDARNFFDPPRKPDFTRNQFGFTLGGPIRRDRTFFFAGYEGLRENLGRTISTVVPDEAARTGVLTTSNGGTTVVPVDPAVRPYLDEFPLPNGPSIGGGLGELTFPFEQQIDQDYFQARLDHNAGAQDSLFVRYTLDTARHHLPTDFPQFPRTFLSRNHFATGELRHVPSTRAVHTLRFGFSRTSLGQEVEANTSRPLAPFVPGRASLGNIDIGGIPRFGPQVTATLSLAQEVLAAEYGLVLSRDRHLLKAGASVEHYRQDMSNETFSRGIFAFANLEGFLRNQPLRFVGLRPEADVERKWRSTLFAAYVQDELRLTPRLTVNVGARYEYLTLPKDVEGRDASLVRISDTEPFVGQLFEKTPTFNFSPRFGFAWDVTGDGRTALRGGYGVYFNTNVQQNLIVTVTNPPVTPRLVVPRPTFPVPSFGASVSNSIRPVQWDLVSPKVHVWNVNLQRELGWDTAMTLGYAGSRGIDLLRNADVNVPGPEILPDGTPFFPSGVSRPNPAFSTIEQKRSDGDSWYNALVLEVRRRYAGGFGFQVSWTFSRNIDTTQSSTFFSDSTNGTTSAFPELPELGIDYNRGLADYHAKHNLVVNATWDVPLARDADGLVRALFAGWQASVIGRYRSGPPLTVFVQANRSRSLWSPSLAPGLGQDRPDLAPGRTAEDAVLGQADQWFDPSAFALQPAGELGNLGRNALIGPELKVVDLSLSKTIPWQPLGSDSRVELRIDAFNVFNHTNLGSPALQAFAGVEDGEQPLPSFGRIRSTTTSSRQIQLGLRVVF